MILANIVTVARCVVTNCRRGVDPRWSPRRGRRAAGSSLQRQGPGWRTRRELVPRLVRLPAAADVGADHGLRAVAGAHGRQDFGADDSVPAAERNSKRAAAPPRLRIFRGDESRRRRGRDVDIPRRRASHRRYAPTASPTVTQTEPPTTIYAPSPAPTVKTTSEPTLYAPSLAPTPAPTSQYKPSLAPAPVPGGLTSRPTRDPTSRPAGVLPGETAEPTREPTAVTTAPTLRRPERRRVDTAATIRRPPPRGRRAG